MEYSKNDKEYIKHINRIMDKKFCKDFFGIDDESMIRQFIHILTKKEKLNFCKEMSYYREIYTGLTPRQHFKALLDKYKRQKFHNVVFSKSDYDNINDHIELKRLELEYENLYGSNFNEDLENDKLDLSRFK
jgi:beta-phosphoglucomutase-like phosphatase (HAD superfamily)